MSLVFALTMGSSGHDSLSFINNARTASSSDIMYTMLGGAVFNLANLLLVAGIDMAGLSVALPVSIGIALVVGVVLSYIRQPKGNAVFLAAGVVCALIAVVLDGMAFGSLPSAHSASRKSIIVCIISGVLMGMWAPLVTGPMRHEVNGNTVGTLTPYSTAVFLTLGALLSCFIWNIYFMKNPLVGAPVNFGEFFRGPRSGHLLGLAGGLIWGTGMVFNLVAASLTGVAISYAIGQSAPMVGALWGIFAWHEFDGAGSRARVYLTFMFLFYAIAILLVAHANG